MSEAAELAVQATFRVGDWHVDPASREIRPADGEQPSGEIQRLGHKPLSLLQCLAERPGRVVTKDELIEQVWDGDVTTDDAVMAVVYELRKALGDDARSPRYVETIRQRGYRLVAPVAPEGGFGAGTVAGAGRSGVSGRASGHGAGRLLAAGLFVVLVAVLAVVWRSYQGSADSGTDGEPPEPAQVQVVPSIRSLAIRPLAAFGDLCMEDPFVDSLTELLIAELVDGPPLEILGAADGAPWPTEPTADAVVEGSIIRSGDGIWVNVRLVESATGRLIWGASYERQGVNLLLERALAAKIAADLLEVME